ncbi:MAG: glycosyltransferase family 2 protein [Proteobacteria bacterium]|nr:glycosyltransferase family 2 protein [Pseudomonadota bacterium]
MNPCAIVPSHDHWRSLGLVVAALRANDLPVFIVDDASGSEAAARIAALSDSAGGVQVIRLDVNRGKGGAVAEGFRKAAAAGFTHAVQVDADNQHDLAALPKLLAEARANPEALVSGRAIFDASVPFGRRIGRYVTHFWVWIETLSFAIPDSMCGFRVYPLVPVIGLLDTELVGQRMDFDTEIAVRLHWRGVEFRTVPVRVVYPAGNFSNFDMLADNWRISRMHTRLVFGMLGRLPALMLRRHGRESHSHWAALAERGAYWGLRFCASAYRLLGRRACLVVISPVVFYFFLAARRQRAASKDFLARALGRPATWREALRHFMSFAGRVLDVFGGWTGRIPPSAVIATDPEFLKRASADPQGALVVVSHLGNVDISRATLDPGMRARLKVLVHTRHALNYNRLLAEACPGAMPDLLQVTELGVAATIALKEQVERGNWVVISGDRTPVGGVGRTSRVPFFGAPAPFPQGPWILASLLDCPVHLLFCVKDGDRWLLTLEPFAERIVLARATRTAELAALCSRYAARLEAYARRAPYQWFNFFDFWKDGEGR